MALTKLRLAWCRRDIRLLMNSLHAGFEIHFPKRSLGAEDMGNFRCLRVVVFPPLVEYGGKSFSVTHRLGVRHSAAGFNR